MSKEILEFNTLLTRGKMIAVLSTSEGNVEAAINAKLTKAVFIDSLEEAIKSSFDFEDVAIISATSSDYGHKLNLKISYVQDGIENTELYYLTATSIY